MAALRMHRLKQDLLRPRSMFYRPIIEHPGHRTKELLKTREYMLVRALYIFLSNVPTLLQLYLVNIQC